MKRLPALAVCLVALLCAALAQAADEVVVGSITPLSGKLAVYGEGFQQAMLLPLMRSMPQEE